MVVGLDPEVEVKILSVLTVWPKGMSVGEIANLTKVDVEMVNRALVIMYACGQIMRQLRPKQRKGTGDYYAYWRPLAVGCGDPG